MTAELRPEMTDIEALQYKHDLLIHEYQKVLYRLRENNRISRSRLKRVRGLRSVLKEKEDIYA